MYDPGTALTSILTFDTLSVIHYSLSPNLGTVAFTQISASGSSAPTR